MHQIIFSQIWQARSFGFSLVSTFAWLELDGHPGDIALNDVDGVFMGSFIMSNEEEIVCIGNSHCDVMIGGLNSV